MFSFLSCKQISINSHTSEDNSVPEGEPNINQIINSLDFFSKQIESGEVINETILNNHKRELVSIKTSFEKQVKEVDEYLESIILANNYCKTTKTILKFKKPRLEEPIHSDSDESPNPTSRTPSISSRLSVSSTISSSSHLIHATCCSCSRGCSNNHCVCKKNGKKCGSACSCVSCKN
jgi:hypothetical protein